LNWMARYFGTNGVRGLFDALGPELAMRLAQAIGSYFKRGKIIVARDGRLTGECIKHAVIAGLQSVGCEVVDLDYASAPTAEFMIKRLKAGGLIIITASHNPPEWNALKVVDGKGVTVSRERGEKIESLIGSPDRVAWDGVKPVISYKSASKEHIDAIVKLVDAKRIRARKLKLVLDCGNGMAAFIAPALFRELGCQVAVMNGDVDGRFPGRPSEPTEANVQGLLETVKSSGADAGIAWDSDSDRVIFVDETGRYVIGDKVFALSVLWKLGKKGGSAIITTVATSRAAEEIAGRFGARANYTKIGAPYLSEEIAKGHAVMAGEEVGGVIWPELSLAKDGFMTAAKMAEALCEKPLSGWLKEIPTYSNVKAKIPAASEEEKGIIVGRVRREAEKRKLKTIQIDGVRADFGESWLICRPSGTESYVRIFAEAKSEAKAKSLLEEWKRIATGS
jgi:phosphomannomutase/phosphoglucomutase